jgi:hypothetical protein
MTAPFIVKADGSQEDFSEEKLAASLRRTGAGAHTAERIARTITSSVGATVSSSEIFRKALLMLRREARPAAARYALRRAFLELGPTGHPFEDFVGQLFAAEGWKVSTRNLIQGHCVEHEVDLVAERDNDCLVAELKYHNDASYKTDLKIALYVQARFEDIAKGAKSRMNRGMLITNTKFTSQAIQYAQCSGMELLGWSYPDEGGLYDRVVASALYPVTTLMSLKQAEKRLLIGQGIVTSALLREHRDVLRTLGIQPERIGEVVAEMDSLVEPFSRN